ncbi:MAG: porphobilinogen synthase [Ardenticatenia bacterium]|jgi:porphobilinogen synthase|nr:MAG: porphobilinogen synthase [Ardenticatenia bacterium]
MHFPIVRPRRLRATPTLRDMVRETQLNPQDFIYPLFAVHGEAVRRLVSSMPGVYQLSVDQLVREAEECHALGIPAVILFGVPAHKDAQGSENFSDDGIVQSAVRAIKAALPQLIVIADVCMCEYTDHGHCGVVRDGQIDNDATLEILQRAAVSYARAGADIVAPSGMMDGMVAAIRSALDEAGFATVSILSYAIKYASAFYSPFREAAEGAPKFGDRKTHQMDPANAREALRELELDIQEGADMVMVKPALPYLDIVYRVRQATHVPVAAYNVSGEYAMVKAAAANGWLDERAVVLELLTSIKRAGADLILTYHAKDAARWLAGM